MGFVFAVMQLSLRRLELPYIVAMKAMVPLRLACSEQKDDVLQKPSKFKTP
jgi:hypothetical protein